MPPKKTVKRALIGALLLIAVGSCVTASLLFVKNGKEAIESDQAAEAVRAAVEEGKKSGASVDVASGRQAYPDLVAWIRVPDTPIDYPVMASDGDYYLNHTPSNGVSSLGSIYCYDTQIVSPHEKMDKNIVLFGHHGLYQRMFGSLSRIYSEGRVTDANRNKIYLSTDDGEYVFEMFSAYKISKDKDFGRVNFANDKDFVSYCEKLCSRSGTKNKNIRSFDGEDQIITLVSCAGDDQNKRVVVHGKCVKFTENKGEK